MKCAYCGYDGPLKGVKHPAYTVIRKGRTYHFCSLKCVRSWIIRRSDLDEN